MNLSILIPWGVQFLMLYMLYTRTEFELTNYSVVVFKHCSFV
jgi:hypothetical protein